jgi:hypothetical protein
MPVEKLAIAPTHLPDSIATNLGHATVDDKVSSVDKAALITGQEDNSVCLLNSLTETSSREVNLTTLALGLVITQPVLQERSVERSRAQSVESEAFTRVHNGELTSHCENSTLAGCVCQLRCCCSDQSDDGSSVDNGALGLVVLAQRLHCVL